MVQLSQESFHQIGGRGSRTSHSIFSFFRNKAIDPSGLLVVGFDTQWYQPPKRQKGRTHNKEQNVHLSSTKKKYENKNKKKEKEQGGKIPEVIVLQADR